jgi:hypothetical protein
MKYRSLLVIILTVSMLLYGLAAVLTHVGAVSAYPVTITWGPPPVVTGYTFINVAGTNYTAPPPTFSWAPGSQHNLTAYLSVFDGIRGKLWIFWNWTDGAGVFTQQSIIYTVVGADTVTANFKWFWAGDLNFDGSVDIYDAVLFSSAFGASVGMPNYNIYADMLHHGVVDIFDAILLAANFGKTSPYTSF